MTKFKGNHTNKKPNPYNIKSLAITGLTLATLITGMKCGKSTPFTPEPILDKYYNITPYVQNIFTGKDIDGSLVILNGERKSSGSVYSVKNGVISEVYVKQVPGFKPIYIAGKSPSGEKHIIRDKNGSHAITITRESDLYLQLIPNDFDTELLAKCVGRTQPTANGESMGNGIIQNWGDKQNIPTGIHAFNAQPTAKTYEIIRTVRKELNNLFYNPNLGRLLYLQEFNDVNSEVGCGFTAQVATIGGGHNETMIGNVIAQSKALISATAIVKGRFKAEAFQAVTGIRLDAGQDAMPYISIYGPNYDFQNDAQRAAWLANLLPPGFHLYTDSTPTSVQARIYETTNRDPNYVYINEPNEPGLMDFMNPTRGHGYGEQPRVRKIPRKQYEREKIKK